MSLACGRILRRAELASEPAALRFAAPSDALPCGRLLKRTEREAKERAREILAAAEARAVEVTQASARALAERQLVAETEARASAFAALATHATRLARREATSDEKQLDRILSVARLLAERIIGAELSLDDGRILALAREVLLELRGARQVTLEAHPEDARVLRSRLSNDSAVEETCDVVANELLGRGQLRLRTEVGVVDARIEGRLELLAEKLREGLRP